MGTDFSLRRNKQLAMIHLAKKDLGLDDETYRAMLKNVADVTSASELTAYGLGQVIEHLRAKGWEPKVKARPRPAEDRVRLVKKIRRLLMNDNRPDAYADGMSAHMFGVDKFEWCNPEQLKKIVAALAIDARRRRGKAHA